MLAVQTFPAFYHLQPILEVHFYELVVKMGRAEYYARHLPNYRICLTTVVTPLHDLHMRDNS